MDEQIERDTHFAGFAKLLRDELNEAWKQYRRNLAIISYEEYSQDILQIITRRAYDLAVFLFESADPLHFDMKRASHERPGEGIYDYHQLVKQLPDMPELPHEPD